MNIVRISRQSSRKPPYDFYEMELIGDHHFSVAVPIDAEEDLKIKVLGAIKTHLAGQKSVDYVLKRYGYNWSFPAPENDIQNMLMVLRAIDDTVSEIIEKISNGKNKPDHVGLFAAEMALMRLKPTFRSAAFLIMQGYSFEASALCRLILEQFGFAYTVYEMDDAEKVIKTRPSKTISNLKDLIPYSGKLYGDLSSKAHLDPKRNRHYITEKDGTLFVRLKLREDAKAILYYLVNLAVDFKKLSTKILGKYFTEISDKHRFSVERNKVILRDAIRRFEEEVF